MIRNVYLKLFFVLAIELICHKRLLKNESKCLISDNCFCNVIKRFSDEGNAVSIKTEHIL